LIELSPSVTTNARARSASLRRFVPLTMVALDACLIYAAFILAYWLRYTMQLGPHIQQHITFWRYQPLTGILLLVMMLVLVVKDAYRRRMSRDVVAEAITIFSASTISVAAIVVVTAMLHQWEYSRAVILYVWVLAIALVISGRALHRSLQALYYRKGRGVTRLLVVGATDVGKMIMQSVMNRPDFGYQLVGFVEHRPSPAVQNFGRFRALGTLADVPALAESGVIDEIIIALPASAHEEMWPILSVCERLGVGMKLVPDLFEMSLGRVQIDDIAGIPLLDVQERSLRQVARAAKRATDVIIASVLLLLCAPVIGLLGLLLRLESDGPAFLRQQRVGVNGRPFTCLKLRTMRVDAGDVQASLQAMNDSDGPLFKLRNDPRCTPLGKRIRRWSLDELPQLWNVVRNDMSLVGPRPPLPQEVAQYDDRQMRRLEVKPGMTGIWQISGRSDLSFDEMVMMDIHYVENWSLGLDVTILLRTLAAVLARHGAY
jgi:exopolysaccharide biosynthesis polyprenyl glycosylphosphotransferase